MRTLLSALAVGLLVLVAAPQIALACHKDTPHGMETSCDGVPTSRIVFITSDTYDGGLNPDPNPNSIPCGTGVAGGNCICQYHADQAGLSGVFLAWLADDMGNPFNTWAQSEVPWVRVDGVMVALNWDDLFDGTILAAIEVDEEGNHPAVGLPFGSAQVWTGTDAVGNSAGNENNTCTQWTSTDGTGANGRTAGDHTGDWSLAVLTAPCSEDKHLYCFEQ